MISHASKNVRPTPAPASETKQKGETNTFETDVSGKLSAFQLMADQSQQQKQLQTYSQIANGSPNASLMSGTPANQVVQRQPISKAEAIEALSALGEFYNAPYEIMTPWGDDGGTNCHGYTLSGDVGTWIDGGELLSSIGDDDPVMVFVKGGYIDHSGKIIGSNKISHFLIGVGILESTVSGAMGYEQHFILPEERAELEEYLNQISPGDLLGALNEIEAELGIEPAEGLKESIYAWEDGEGDEQTAIANYNAFLDLHEELADYKRY